MFDIRGDARQRAVSLDGWARFDNGGKHYLPNTGCFVYWDRARKAPTNKHDPRTRFISLLFIGSIPTAATSGYRNFGFVEEGIKQKARFLDGEFDNILLMALLHGSAGHLT